MYPSFAHHRHGVRGSFLGSFIQWRMRPACMHVAVVRRSPASSLRCTSRKVTDACNLLWRSAPWADAPFSIAFGVFYKVNFRIWKSRPAFHAHSLACLWCPVNRVLNLSHRYSPWVGVPFSSLVARSRSQRASIALSSASDTPGHLASAASRILSLLALPFPVANFLISLGE